MALPGGGELAAYAAYVFDLEGGALRMHFAEQPPRLFQTFALSTDEDALVADSVHSCPPDTYRSRIAFSPDGAWALIHTVSGPRKAYVSVTRYRPDAVQSVTAI